VKSRSQPVKNDASYLGQVIRVDSSTVEVEVSASIPSSAPIINGRLYKIGQIGTFVKMPMGNITIYAIVGAVSDRPFSENPDTEDRTSSKFLSVQLVGEKIGDGQFEKGIGTYPTIGDEVHLVIEKDLFEIYGEKDSGSIEIGKHSSSENLSVHVDTHNLILRHCGILGSTGSGKSNTTVSILKAILDSYVGSRAILVDPHGEYASAFPGAKVFKIGDVTFPLFIPFWLMSFDELIYFLVGADARDEQKIEYRMLKDLVTSLKKENTNLKSGIVNADLVTADSPIPFSARALWHRINWSLNATFSSATKDEQTVSTACQITAGDAESLTPATFTPYVMGAAAPYKSKHTEFYSYEQKIISKLRDSRYDFLFNPGDYKTADSPKDLHNLLADWIGNDNKLTILDLSGVPFEVLDISIGLITRFVYDSMFWGRNEPYTGKQRPLLLAYEEAHTYLGKNDKSNYSKSAVERVFKEGRKFGVGALVISQRPSELSETILSQIGTMIALRLTNSSDQAIVKASSPDNLNSLMDLLPSLRIGEAVISGEAIKIPSRVRLKLNTPRPTSEDPALVECWSTTHLHEEDFYKAVVTKIRERKI
jgi:DNA helicase HerA-like ATPase